SLSQSSRSRPRCRRSHCDRTFHRHLHDRGQEARIMTATRRHWALVILGAWIAGSICMSVVATENFYTIDRLLGSRANAAFGAAVDRLGAVEARDLLRYLASELNRLYFQLWNGAQIALGVLALWLLSGSAAPPLGRHTLQSRE